MPGESGPFTAIVPIHCSCQIFHDPEAVRVRIVGDAEDDLMKHKRRDPSQDSNRLLVIIIVIFLLILVSLLIPLLIH